MTLVSESVGTTSSGRGYVIQERRLESDPAPLSLGQEQLWFLAQLAPDLPVYNEQVVMRRRGPLDARAVELSLQEIARRHTVWRTLIVSRDGRPVQVIHPPGPITMEVSDLSGLPPHRREAAAAKLATEDLVKPFDLERGPLWRARLVRVGQEDHRLYLALHHIMFDGFSIFRILAPELTALYAVYASGAEPRLPEPRIAYDNFARSQHAAAESPAVHRQLEYWRQRLAGLPALDLPADYPRPPLQSFQGAMHRFSIPRPLVDRLQSVAASQGATLFTVLLATFAAVLHRLTGQEDIVVGTLSSGRRLPELADVFGYFLNPLVVRVGLGGDPDGRQVISRVQEVLLEALANDEVAFERVVRELGGTRDPGRNPLFQVMLTLEPSLPELPPGWAVSQNEVDDGTSKFDLSVELDERPEGMIARLAYRTDLFQASTIRRVVEAWRRVLEAIAARPDTKLQEVPVLGEAERHTLLVGWNATAMAYDEELCVHQAFEAQVERTPDAVALVAGSERLTYRELDRKANQLGHHLRGLGLGPGARVGIYAERSAAMVVALLGVLKAGAAYVPMDPAFPARRIEFIVGDARVPVVVTTRELAGGLAGCGARLVLLDAEAEAIGREEEGPVASGVSAEELAYVMYTSGSTGTPKGVQVTHRNVVNFFAAMDERLEHEPPGVWLAVTSISFDISVLELFWTLARGFQVVLYAGDETAAPVAVGEVEVRHPVAWLIEERGVTHLQCTPSFASMLLASPGCGEALGRLKQLMIGGEPFPVGLARELRRVMSGSIVNMYGPTETTIWSSTYELGQEIGEWETIPIGRPIGNTTFYVLDGQMRPVPVGVKGELYIGGEGVTRGYLERPELNRERFLADPFGRRAGECLYRTGDLARYREDGLVEHLGRVDNQVKLRGYRIELGEIESVLSTHPEVRENAVVVRGEGAEEERLVAYLVARQGQGGGPSVAELRQYLQERLPKYMVPAAFELLDALPRTPNGKVDRKSLPDPQRRDASDPLVAPRDEVERELVEIWERELKVQPIGINENFFNLGGHSLLAVQIFNEIAASFGTRLPLATLLHSPTVELLAETLRQAP